MSSESSLPFPFSSGAFHFFFILEIFIILTHLLSSRQIRENVATHIAADPSLKPALAIIQQGDRPDSSTYVRMKQKAAEECAIRFLHITLPADASEQTVANEIARLNADPTIDGLLVQLPLSKHIGSAGERRITESVSPHKDVDGFHAYNIGLLSSRASEPLFSPCTPAGVIRLIEHTGVPIAGKHAVVLGRSDIVGSPVCALLRRKDATVTQCHSRTKNLPEIVSLASDFFQFSESSIISPSAVGQTIGFGFTCTCMNLCTLRLANDQSMSAVLWGFSNHCPF